MSEKRETICLFAGTTEGRQLAELLSRAVSLTVCVATEYGEVLLDGIPAIEIRAGRMDAEEAETSLPESCADLPFYREHGRGSK